MQTASPSVPATEEDSGVHAACSFSASLGIAAVYRD